MIYYYKFEAKEYDSNTKNNGLLAWMQIEIWYFILWISSLALFTLFTLHAGIYSLFKTDYDDKIMMNDGDEQSDDVWSNKNSDDFLRYFKFEAFTFGYYMT